METAAEKFRIVFLIVKKEGLKREKTENNIEETLQLYEEKIAEEPSQENLQKLETAKSEYDREYDCIVKGLISRAPRAPGAP